MQNIFSHYGIASPYFSLVELNSGCITLKMKTAFSFETFVTTIDNTASYN
jgi:hypothetical protein